MIVLIIIITVRSVFPRSLIKGSNGGGEVTQPRKNLNAGICWSNLELERFRLQKNRVYKYFANFDPLITIRLLWQKVIYTVVIDYL